MANKVQLEDLSYEEISQIIIQREPSYESLKQKVLITLRGLVVLMARLQFIGGVTNKPPPIFFSQISRFLSMLALITRSVDELPLTNKKTSVDAEVQSQSTMEDENGLQGR